MKTDAHARLAALPQPGNLEVGLQGAEPRGI